MKPCMKRIRGRWLCYSEDGRIVCDSTPRGAYLAWLYARTGWLPWWVAA